MSHLLIECPARILEEIITLFADFDITGIEEAAEIYEDRSYCNASIVISDGIQFRPFLERFSKEWDASIFPEPTGDIGLKVLAWGTEEAEVTLLEGDIDYSSFQKITDRKNIVVEFTRFYDYNPRLKQYTYNPADVISNQNHRGTKELFYCKYHVDDSTNKDVVSRSMFLLKFPIFRYQFLVLPQKGNVIDVGMVIEAPLPGTSTGTRLLFVTSKKPSDKGDLLRVFDISTINEGLIILYADADPLIYLLTDTNPKVLI